MEKEIMPGDLDGNMLKIKTYGDRNPMSGLLQLEKAWKELGYEITDFEPDILYHSTGFFSDLLEDSKKYPNAIKIGCLLDANPLNKNWGPPSIVRDQLLQLDIPITISNTAQKQIMNRTGVKCQVVYYPIKNLTKLKYPSRGIRMLVVGRVYSQNKRLQLIHDTAEKYCGDPEQIVFVGPEKPPFGIYGGLVDEEMLNVCYNSTVFLLGLSSVEGMYLSPLEACTVNTIPIVTSDNECMGEFDLIKHFAAEPHPIKLANKMKEIEKNFDKYQDIANQLGEKFKNRFSAKMIAQNILDLYWAYKKKLQ